MEYVAKTIIKQRIEWLNSPIIIRPSGIKPLIGMVAFEQMGYRVYPITGKADQKTAIYALSIYLIENLALQMLTYSYTFLVKFPRDMCEYVDTHISC